MLYYNDDSRQTQEMDELKLIMDRIQLSCSSKGPH